MKRLLLTALFLTLTAGPLGMPQASAEPVRSAHTEAELISEVTSVAPGSTFWVAVHLRMDPKWHTYWRNPGDSGLATHLDWDLPEGFQAGPVEWPYPERVDLPPLSVYAYEGEVLLLTRLQAPDTLVPGTTVPLRVRARWLACEVNCIPGEASLELTLPVMDQVPAPDPEKVKLFAAARAKLPLKTSGWEIQASGSEKDFQIEITHPEGFSYPLKSVSFFPYDDSLIDHAVAQKFRAAQKGYVLQVKRSRLEAPLPERLEGILVASEGWRGPGSEQALEISLPVGTALPGSEVPEPSGMSLWTALLSAFLGGLILNLMPCVFPVLSIKILNFVDQAQQKKTSPGLHGLAFTAGVLLSFWLLAGALLLLRAGGREIGWGFQLQSSAFLVFLAVLFFLLGLNLFGLFEIGTGLTGLGGLLAGRSGLGESFFGGILATVIATPCTAPFMGAALGYALTQPAGVSLVVFTSLGLGMAAPYQVLSLFPSLLRFIPRPGAWMITLKRVMGVLLLATVAWLAWILDLQRGRTAAAFLGAGFVLTTAGFLLFRRQGFRPAAWAILLAGLLLPFAGLKAAPSSSLTLSRSVAPGQGLHWEVYSPERLEALRREGTPVFLDFTAAWCLTCHVNEKVALDSAKVRERFEALGIVPMKADWTSRDESITRALAMYGRSSIPLYVLYGPAAAAPPVLLPEVLTPEIVLNTVEKVFKDSLSS